MLKGYLKDRRWIVVSELAHAVNPLEIALVREILLRGGGIPDGIASQIYDLTRCQPSPVSKRSSGSTRVTDLTRCQPSPSPNARSGKHASRGPHPLSGLANLQRIGLEARRSQTSPRCQPSPVSNARSERLLKVRHERFN